VSQKRIPNINDCNLKRDYQILIMFGTNIPDTTGHPMIVQVPTSPSVCSCTTWENHNKRNITFVFKAVIKITHIKHILSRFLSFWLTVYPVLQFSNCLQKIFEITALCATQASRCFLHSLIAVFDNVLLQTSTSRFLSSSTFLNGVQ